MQIEKQLAEHGYSLPTKAKPAANYCPYLISNQQIYISGQLPILADGTIITGKVPTKTAVEKAYLAAQACCLQILSQLQNAVDQHSIQIKRCIKLTGFINAEQEFHEHPKVINGASDLLVQCFGDNGQHCRAAVGCNSLPLDAATEIEALFELQTD